jgi:hypothetical protein
MQPRLRVSQRWSGEARGGPRVGQGAIRALGVPMLGPKCGSVAGSNATLGDSGRVEHRDGCTPPAVDGGDKQRAG